MSTKIAALSVSWVETIGRQSEDLHDLVDQAAVALGRQAKVGEGNPMTAWHDDLVDEGAIADYIILGGHGSSQNKLVVVIGSIENSARLIQLLREKANG